VARCPAGLRGRGSLTWLEITRYGPGSPSYACYRYAGEAWREFKRDAEGWKTLLALASVDLSLEENRLDALAAFRALVGQPIETAEAALELTRPPPDAELRWVRPSVPAEAVLSERFAPPAVTASAWTFLASVEAGHQGETDIVRVVVNLHPVSLTTEPVCRGRQRGMERQLRMGVGRAYVTETGAALAAEVVSAGGAPAATVARAWREAARIEHASVASFARGTLELLALGAPLDLVERTQAAARDEVRHARLSLAIARRLERGETGPLDLAASLDASFGPLQVLPARAASHARLAVDTLLEAAVPETLGAWSAAVASEGCRDGVVARVAADIAADEERHAALAWDVVRWCVQQDEGARVALGKAAASLAPPSSSPSLVTEDGHGLLSPETELRAWHDAFHARVAPWLRGLLG
jgi:hypothetical protein